jgi:hypothetical protein
VGQASRILHNGICSKLITSHHIRSCIFPWQGAICLALNILPWQGANTPRRGFIACADAALVCGVGRMLPFAIAVKISELGAWFNR